MKKILIATDFSVPAENAARYALTLAKKLKADILLCNAFKVPAEAPMASQVAWPLMDYGELKQQATSELDSLVKTLSDQACSVVEDDYCPNISYQSGVGGVCEVVSSFVETEKIDFIVMGIAGAGGLIQLILGSNTKEMIEKTRVPLLLVPFEAIYTGIKKIAFATDLNTEDLPAIQFVMDLAKKLDAAVTIVHVTNKEVDPTGKTQHFIDNFVDKMASSVNFSTVNYEYVWNIDIDSGLKWIGNEEDLGLMAITHHKHNLLTKMFKGSHTQKLSRHIKTPLLVFPSKYKHNDEF